MENERKVNVPVVKCLVREVAGCTCPDEVRVELVPLVRATVNSDNAEAFYGAVAKQGGRSEQASRAWRSRV
jgi:hypothetical protein